MKRIKATGMVYRKSKYLKDFERAFGYTPKEAIEAIALFTDNDQTKEPVLAYYEWGRLECRTDRES